MATFNNPTGLAISPDGLVLFVAEHDSNMVRKILLATGTVTTLAGNGAVATADGPATAASFAHPVQLGVSPDGRFLYVSQDNAGAPGNGAVRAVAVATGLVTTLADLPLNDPYGVVVAPGGGSLFVADANNNLLRRVNTSTGAVATLAGTGAAGYGDGPAGSAVFNGPRGLALSRIVPCPAAARPPATPPSGPGSGPCELPGLAWSVRLSQPGQSLP